jgi:DNA polymerase-1
LIGTYLRNFAESAKLYNGKFFPYYNQTRNEDDYGTRTGRFSSNIQQLPKRALFTAKDDSAVLDDLPNPRSLIVARPGYTLIKRDFAGQEVRVLSHYSEGALLDAYNNDPKMDVHQYVKDLIASATGVNMNRSFVKTINFLKIYGGGVKLLAYKLGVSEQEARQFFTAYDQALPGIKQLMIDIETLAKKGKKIYTWGGRGYDVEIDAQGRKLYYKLGNILIQGSSADMTKEAMIRYWYRPDRKGEILMQVHDEIVLEVPNEFVDSEMAILRWSMDDIPGWDVKLTSDGEVGQNLYYMEAYND